MGGDALMRVGVIGRTEMLLSAARAVAHAGHEISFVQTCRAEPHYSASAADFERLAAEVGAPFLCSQNTRRATELWTRTATDVAISANWPVMIDDGALRALEFGILNAHAGDLPRYRGNACPNWAILSFDSRIGLTIHRMETELDAGPVLYKTFLEIDEKTYVGDIYKWLDAAVPQAFVSALRRLPSPGFVEQDAGVRPLRAFPRRPEDARIVWSASVRDVLALIRASSHPFDGAFTTLEGDQIIRIFRARPHEPEYDFLAVPGQVCTRLGRNPIMATGDGMIEIENCSTPDRDDAATKALILRSMRNRLV